MNFQMVMLIAVLFFLALILVSVRPYLMTTKDNFLAFLGIGDYQAKKLLNQADAAFDSKEYNEALELYKKFLDKYPNNPDAYRAQLGVAKSYKELGEYDNAIESYNKVSSYPIHPKLKSKVDEMVKLYIENAKLTSEVNPYEEAKKLLDEGNYQEAINKFEVYIKEHPDSSLLAQAQIRIGESYFKLGDYINSEKAYKNALENYVNLMSEEQKATVQTMIESSINSLFNLAKREFDRGNYRGAINRFETFLIEHPGYLAQTDEFEVDYVILESYYNLDECDKVIEKGDKIVTEYSFEQAPQTRAKLDNLVNDCKAKVAS